ncbi:MAG: hypothetical protein GX601_14235 [Anaerolineales bacterium]|nr:hypothetical protein [Anaerolineales bacterium]
MSEQRQSRPRPPCGAACAAAAICLLGFALRLYRIEAQSLWWDEAISLHLATSTLGQILADRAAHVHPPLYFLLLKGWVSVAGVSAFSARLSSTLANTALIATAYAVGRRHAGRSTGLAAALVTAGSALYVVYSQEVRTYAALPLLYLATLTLVARLRRADAGQQAGWRDWLLLVAVQATGLHLHYIFLLAVGYANLLLLFDHWQKRRPLRRWLLSVALVGLLCLPWLVTVYANRAAVRADVGVDDPFTQQIPMGFFVNLLWTFQWTGLTAAPGYALLQIASLALAALLLVAIVVLLVSRSARRTTIRLLLHWAAPLAPAVVLWQAKPLSHPRYVALFSVALFIAAAYALVAVRRRGWFGRILALALAVNLTAVTATALWAWYAVPRFGKDDVRGVGAWLEASADANDTIIAPWQDYSLDYAYTGPATIIRPNPGDEAGTWSALAADESKMHQAFLVRYPRDPQDLRRLIPFALESAGYLAERSTLKGLEVLRYTVSQPLLPPPEGTSADVWFGPLGLLTLWIEPNAPADTALTLTARWRLRQPVQERYRIALRLQDPEGWTWASADDWLLDTRSLPTDSWQINETVSTYHVLPLSAGVPPLTYTVAVDVYALDVDGELRYLDLLDAAGNPAGRTYHSRPVSLTPAVGLSTDPYDAAPDLPAPPEPFTVDGLLMLEAAAIDRAAAAPGQAIFVTLRWRALADALPDIRPTLVLSQSSAVASSATAAPAADRYPTDRWRMGEVVLDRRRLTVPPTVQAGPADIRLCVESTCTGLGAVMLNAGEHQYEPPPIPNQVYARLGNIAELLGYDLTPGLYASDEPITITLYWRVLEGASESDYTVFTHLLAEDGRLVAQHDGPPVGSARPTGGWLPSEIIIDEHAMTFREAYSGSAQIEVGMYDSATLTRVVAADGRNSVTLPVQLSIVEP